MKCEQSRARRENKILRKAGGRQCGGLRGTVASSLPAVQLADTADTLASKNENVKIIEKKEQVVQCVKTYFKILTKKHAYQPQCSEKLPKVAKTLTCWRWWYV